MPNRPRRDQVTDWLGMQDAPVTVAQICAGAGVSRPTAYKYVAELSAGGSLTADYTLPGSPRYRLAGAVARAGVRPRRRPGGPRGRVLHHFPDYERDPGGHPLTDCRIEGCGLVPVIWPPVRSQP